MNKFLDFHCHLEHDAFAKRGMRKIVERMVEKNVFAVNTGYALEANKRVLAQCAAFKNLYAAVGLSPHDVPKESLDENLEFAEAHANEIVAIGEIGLDHHHFKKHLEQKAQEKAFLAQLELAEKLGKPVVVHSREAEEKTIEILSSFKNPRVLHFFLEPKLLGKALDAGLYVSVPTFKSKNQARVLENAPLDRILLETDSPYGLNTGGVNEPSNVIVSYERLAEFKKMPLKEVALTIFENFKTITKAVA